MMHKGPPRATDCALVLTRLFQVTASRMWLWCRWRLTLIKHPFLKSHNLGWVGRWCPSLALCLSVGGGHQQVGQTTELQHGNDVSTWKESIPELHCRHTLWVFLQKEELFFHSGLFKEAVLPNIQNTCFLLSSSKRTDNPQTVDLVSSFMLERKLLWHDMIQKKENNPCMKLLTTRCVDYHEFLMSAERTQQLYS